MQKLWAPWRIEYIIGPKEPGCIFCNRVNRNQDREDLILFRGKRAFVIMNKYPYNNGHLMIVPYKHTSALEELDQEDVLELHQLLVFSQKNLQALMNPQGFNIGLNIGQCAGAGIKEHLHYHIVPRWNGDVNFMPVFSDTKVINEFLLESYNKLKKYFEISPEGSNHEE